MPLDVCSCLMPVFSSHPFPRPSQCSLLVCGHTPFKIAAIIYPEIGSPSPALPPFSCSIALSGYSQSSTVQVASFWKVLSWFEAEPQAIYCTFKPIFVSLGYVICTIYAIECVFSSICTFRYLQCSHLVLCKVGSLSMSLRASRSTGSQTTSCQRGSKCTSRDLGSRSSTPGSLPQLP